MADPPPSRFADAPAANPRLRLGVALAIVAVHGLLLLALGGALASGIGAVDPRTPHAALVAMLVRSAPPAAKTGERPRATGASGAAAPHAHADAIAAPLVAPAAPPLAARVAADGSAAQSGAAGTGAGSGGASAGDGSGAGGSGDGAGGGRKPVKLAGELTEADFARAGRARRLGTATIVILHLGTDGRVTACRVHQPSGDPDADATVCRLAMARFRFDPARDGAGHPVEADFGWQQRFFAP